MATTTDAPFKFQRFQWFWYTPNLSNKHLQHRKKCTSIEDPGTGTRVLDNTRPYLRSSIVSFQITLALNNITYRVILVHQKYSSIYHYHLVDINTSILLVESQVILNRISGFKSKNILKCAFKAKTRKAQCEWCVWRACVSKALPQTGNTVPYYLFDHGNTENINLNILLSCLVVKMSKNCNWKVIYFDLWTK